MRHLACAMISLVLSAGVALAAPPRVVLATPDNGDVNVDPALTEIRVTFDQPMDTRGRSIVGGGDSFPEIAGHIRWIGRTTIVIPVTLKPDHEYWLSINNQQYRNFANARGESAVPYPIRFSTGSADGADDPAATNDQQALNAAAVDRLREALESSYSYRDRTGVDWGELLDDKREALERVRTPGAFARLAATLLAKAEDKHLWLEACGSRLPTFQSPPVANVNPLLLPMLVPEYEWISPVVATGRWTDNIGYVQIDSWDGSQREAVEAAFDAVWRLHDARAIIVDVRLNGGGDEQLARALAGCFIDEPIVYAKNRYVDPTAPGGFGPIIERTLEPSTRRPRFPGPVVVLSGPVVMSSNEAFILMMKAAPRATVVGGTTQGSSGNPKPHELGNGVTAWVPSWQAMTPDGTPFEGVGIQPDVPVELDPAALNRTDPALQQALDHARGR